MGKPFGNGRAIQFVIIFLVMALGSFGYYLFNYDYKVKPNDGLREIEEIVSLRFIKPVLRIDDSKATSPSLEFSLFNSGYSKTSLMDSIGLSPFFRVNLTYSAMEGQPFQAVPPNAQSPIKASSENEADTCKVELLPGSALTKKIPLSSLFNTSRLGFYETTVTYQSNVVAKSAESLTCKLKFELPLKK